MHEPARTSRFAEDWKFKRPFPPPVGPQVGYRSIVLSTSELQVPAIRLYESSGFQLLRTEVSEITSHKAVGAGRKRFQYEKALVAAG